MPKHLTGTISLPKTNVGRRVIIALSTAAVALAIILVPLIGPMLP